VTLSGVGEYVGTAVFLVLWMAFVWVLVFAGLWALKRVAGRLSRHKGMG
jgi:hypothetical protein